MSIAVCICCNYKYTPRQHSRWRMFDFIMTICSSNLFDCFFVASQTYLLEGEPPTLDFLGIVFGHVYYHFTKSGLLGAPDWLITWYDESPNAQVLRNKYKTIGSDFAP